jgi:ABC-type polysaccharide/polyol phosphate transport system ATPase subunit
LIDEAFSVGDAHFRESVRTLIKSAESRKLLFVIASHDMSQLQEVCTHCLWLKQGELRYFGVAKSEIFERYLDETKEISEIRC